MTGEIKIGRPKKGERSESGNITVRIEPAVAVQLRDHSARTGIKINFLVQRAIEELLAKKG